MPICRNAACPLSYQSNEGRVLVGMVRTLQASHNENRVPAPAIIERLRQLVSRIYQVGPFCAGCEAQDMAFHTGPIEPLELNDLLQNIELLRLYGAL